MIIFEKGREYTQAELDATGIIDMRVNALGYRMFGLRYERHLFDQVDFGHYRHFFSYEVPSTAKTARFIAPVKLK